MTEPLETITGIPAALRHAIGALDGEHSLSGAAATFKVRGGLLEGWAP